MLHTVLSFLDSLYHNNIDSQTMNQIALMYFNEKSFHDILKVKQLNDQKGKEHLFYFENSSLRKYNID